MDMDERDTKKPTHSCYMDEHTKYKVREFAASNKSSGFLVSLSIRLFGGGGGGGGGREEGEKPDTKVLRRVFRPLDEDDASPQIVANQNNFRSCNCHVSDDCCERYDLKLHTQLHCNRLSKQNIFC